MISQWLPDIGATRVPATTSGLVSVVHAVEFDTVHGHFRLVGLVYLKRGTQDCFLAGGRGGHYGGFGRRRRGFF